jgi:hypothetical protein
VVTALDVPTELVIVTLTLPTVDASLLKSNVCVYEKALPYWSDVASAYQVANSEDTSTVTLGSERVCPVAGVNVKSAETISRVLEYPCTVTVMVSPL